MARILFGFPKVCSSLIAFLADLTGSKWIVFISVEKISRFGLNI